MGEQRDQAHKEAEEAVIRMTQAESKADSLQVCVWAGEGMSMKRRGKDWCGARNASLILYDSMWLDMPKNVLKLPMSAYESCKDSVSTMLMLPHGEIN